MTRAKMFSSKEEAFASCLFILEMSYLGLRYVNYRQKTGRILKQHAILGKTYALELSRPEDSSSSGTS